MLSDEKLAELKAKHGELIIIECDDVTVVLRKMKRPEWKKFLQATESGSGSMDAAVAQMRASVVDPPLGQLEELFDEDPPFETALANTYFAESKSKRKIEAKKA